MVSIILYSLSLYLTTPSCTPLMFSYCVTSQTLKSVFFTVDICVVVLYPVTIPAILCCYFSNC